MTTIGGIGELSGCLDTERRAMLSATGAVVQSVIPDPKCTHTIFTFEIALDRLVELASLDWIIELEGPQRMGTE